MAMSRTCPLCGAHLDPGEYKCDCQQEKASKKRKPSPYERTRAAVEATGNKWAIENFNATHN